eukprot:15454546-Alexandrium_andersonii.AAC.1
MAVHACPGMARAPLLCARCKPVLARSEHEQEAMLNAPVDMRSATPGFAVSQGRWALCARTASVATHANTHTYARTRAHVHTHKHTHM